jgi:glycosyltransferase involved in cell wall biosynthesis
VVIPVHNGGRFLGEALASVRAQTWRPLEIIVVDDGSTDDSVEVAARWAEVVLLRQKRRGASAARNAGIARASGAFVALLDADDVWTPDKLRVQIEHLEAHPEIGYVAALMQNFLEPGTPRPSWLSERKLSEPQPGALSNLVARAETLRGVGPFDTGEAGDLDWSLRAQAAGVAGAVLPAVLTRRRIHDANVSHDPGDLRAITLRALRAAIARRRTAGP